ncbi:ligand-dependent nuclear receptor-interacting factor 1 [Dendrobates tinctorius]|uniref:ligand-dependent nuclear receptor-interacting factor 1 n=1 Tax=Dendrobates tinctorius TaxID=92724 RepID=UPI003CC9AA2E
MSHPQLSPPGQWARSGQGLTGCFYQVVQTTGPQGTNVLNLLPILKPKEKSFPAAPPAPAPSTPVLNVPPAVISSPAPSLPVLSRPSPVSMPLVQTPTLGNYIISAQGNTLHVENQFPVYQEATLFLDRGQLTLPANSVPGNPPTFIMVNTKPASPIKPMPKLPSGHSLQIPSHAEVISVPVSSLPFSIQQKILPQARVSDVSKVPSVIYVSPVNTVKASAAQSSQSNPSPDTKSPLQTRPLSGVSEALKEPMKWVVQEDQESASCVVPVKSSNETASKILQKLTKTKMEDIIVTNPDQSKVVQIKDNALVMCNNKIFFLTKKGAEIINAGSKIPEPPQFVTPEKPTSNVKPMNELSNKVVQVVLAKNKSPSPGSETTVQSNVSTAKPKRKSSTPQAVRSDPSVLYMSEDSGSNVSRELWGAPPSAAGAPSRSANTLSRAASSSPCSPSAPSSTAGAPSHSVSALFRAAGRSPCSAGAPSSATSTPSHSASTLSRAAGGSLCSASAPSSATGALSRSVSALFRAAGRSPCLAGAPSSTAGAPSHLASALSGAAGSSSCSASALSSAAGAPSRSASALSCAGGAPSRSASALSSAAGAPSRSASALSNVVGTPSCSASALSSAAIAPSHLASALSSAAIASSHYLASALSNAAGAPSCSASALSSVGGAPSSAAIAPSSASTFVVNTANKGDTVRKTDQLLPNSQKTEIATSPKPPEAKGMDERSWRQKFGLLKKEKIILKRIPLIRAAGTSASNASPPGESGSLVTDPAETPQKQLKRKSPQTGNVTKVQKRWESDGVSHNPPDSEVSDNPSSPVPGETTDESHSAWPHHDAYDPADFQVSPERSGHFSDILLSRPRFHIDSMYPDETTKDEKIQRLKEVLKERENAVEALRRQNM